MHVGPALSLLLAPSKSYVLNPEPRRLALVISAPVCPKGSLLWPRPQLYIPKHTLLAASPLPTSSSLHPSPCPAFTRLPARNNYPACALVAARSPHAQLHPADRQPRDRHCEPRRRYSRSGDAGQARGGLTKTQRWLWVARGEWSVRWCGAVSGGNDRALTCTSQVSRECSCADCIRAEAASACVELTAALVARIASDIAHIVCRLWKSTTRLTTPSPHR
eukprot:350621-Chlamydomonas_euryale.AAC.9